MKQSVVKPKEVVFFKTVKDKQALRLGNPFRTWTFIFRKYCFGHILNPGSSRLRRLLPIDRDHFRFFKCAAYFKTRPPKNPYVMVWYPDCIGDEAFWVGIGKKDICWEEWQAWASSNGASAAALNDEYLKQGYKTVVPDTYEIVEDY